MDSDAGPAPSRADGRALSRSQEHHLRGVPVTISQGHRGCCRLYLPILILGRWVNEGVIGVFAGAAYLITAANLVARRPRRSSFHPSRMQFAAQGPRVYPARAVRINVFLVVAALACMPIIVFAGNRALQFVYGDEFALPTRVLVLLAIAVIPIAPSYLFSSVLAVFNYFRVEVYVWAGALRRCRIRWCGAAQGGVRSLEHRNDHRGGHELDTVRGGVPVHVVDCHRTDVGSVTR